MACTRKDRGIWQRYSWQQYYRNVTLFALGLVSLGLEKGDVACIIGDNEPEWFWGEFGTQAAGGVTTGIFVDSIPGEVKYIAEHSEAKYAIVNDQEQVDKFLEIKRDLPLLRKIIYWDPKGLKNYDDPDLISYNGVLELGREYEKSHSAGFFDEMLEFGKGTDTAFIYYTSGTTGLPKGALCTHQSLITTAVDFLSRYPLSGNNDLISNFPAAWVGDSFFATIPHLISGARLNFAEEPETIANDTREIGPNFAIYGPRQWESLVSDIQVRIIDTHPLKHFIYDLLLPVGYKMANYQIARAKPPVFWKIMNKIAYLLLFRPIKDYVGLSHVRFAVTGSSVLSFDTFKFIHAIGIELRQNYASTEAGFISSHGRDEVNFETVGRPAKDVEVRISNDGELLVRSKCMFSGYYKDNARTAEAIKNGWFHTGDAVNIDDNGHIIFLDRLQDMGELSGGAKYAPQYIEGRLRFSPYIKDAIVIGGKERDYVTAIINMDFTMVGKWAENNRIPYTTFVDLSQKDEIAELIKKDVVRVNKLLPGEATVNKFVLLHKEFDPDEAELTRTRKLRRTFIETKYKELIEALYGSRETIQAKASVTYRDGRKGSVVTGIKVRSVH